MNNENSTTIPAKPDNNVSEQPTQNTRAVPTVPMHYQRSLADEWDQAFVDLKAGVKKRDFLGLVFYVIDPLWGRLKVELKDCAAKSCMLADLQLHSDCLFALHYSIDYFPQRGWKEFAHRVWQLLVDEATPAELAEFRRRVEAAFGTGEEVPGLLTYKGPCRRLRFGFSVGDDSHCHSQADVQAAQAHFYQQLELFQQCRESGAYDQALVHLQSVRKVIEGGYWHPRLRPALLGQTYVGESVVLVLKSVGEFDRSLSDETLFRISKAVEYCNPVQLAQFRELCDSHGALAALHSLAQRGWVCHTWAEPSLDAWTVKSVRPTKSNRSNTRRRAV